MKTFVQTVALANHKLHEISQTTKVIKWKSSREVVKIIEKEKVDWDVYALVNASDKTTRKSTNWGETYHSSPSHFNHRRRIFSSVCFCEFNFIYTTSAWNQPKTNWNCNWKSNLSGYGIIKIRPRWQRSFWFDVGFFFFVLSLFIYSKFCAASRFFLLSFSFSISLYFSIFHCFFLSLTRWLLEMTRCDDVGRTHWESCAYKKRKPFMHILRCVCALYACIKIKH